jgi:hypothetical protein
MPSGTTILMPVAHNEQLAPLVANDSYFQVALYSAQAYVALPFLSQIACLVCAAEVGSNYLENHRIHSLYKVETIKKNQPSPLGLSVDLTEWLPVIPDKKVKVNVKLVAVRDQPFGKLTDAMSDLGLVSSLSLFGPHISEGLRITGIAGKILSTVLDEGAQDNLLSLDVDLSVAELSSGYWAMINPATPGDVATGLRLRSGGRLDDPKAAFSEQNTYAVLKVRALERRGPEAARLTDWGTTLAEGLRQVQRLAGSGTDRDRRKANSVWLDTIDHAQSLAQEDRSFLQNEIREVLQYYELEKRNLLAPETISESTGGEELNEDLQHILGVQDEGELARAVAGYRATVARAAATADTEARLWDS